MENEKILEKSKKLEIAIY